MKDQTGITYPHHQLMMSGRTFCWRTNNLNCFQYCRYVV